MQFASRATIKSITRRQRPTAAARVLERMGVRYTLDGDGWPVVPVRTLDRLYGGALAPGEDFAVDVGALEALGLG
jgi:hypothetical protein